MAVLLTGTGGLYTRLGKVIRMARHLNGSRNNVAPNPSSTWGTGSGAPTIIDIQADYGALYDEFESSNADHALISGLPATLTSFLATVDSELTTLQTFAQAVLVYMVNNDTPLLSQTVSAAMAVLISQMETSGTYVRSNTVTAVGAAAGGNTGTPVIALSTLDHHGVQMQYPFAEVLNVTVTSDTNRGATAGNEGLSISGTPAQSNSLSAAWPDGSGISGVTANIIDFASDNSAGNKLTNSGFELFTVADIPDKWTIVAGSAGVQVTDGATAHGGTTSVAFVGDSSTLTSIKQTFDDSANGTAGTINDLPLGAQTGAVTDGVVAFSIWLYVTATPAAGVLKIDLIDSGNNVINDDAGTPNSVTATLTGFTGATWTNVKGFFRMPTESPASVAVRIHLTTALSTGVTLFIDDFAMGTPTQLYAGGPYVAFFRGDTDVIVTDTFTITVTNNLDQAGGGIFMAWFEKFFGMRTSLGQSLPISGTTLIADTLCT